MQKRSAGPLVSTGLFLLLSGCVSTGKTPAEIHYAQHQDLS
jgi:hypothetical protein